MLEQHIAKEPAKVLLIDDELQVLAAYGRVLRAAGLSVVQVSDTTQLSQVLASNDFDLVISDIRIPRVSGLDVLRTVRQRNPDLPVVLMTAVGDLDSAMQAMEQGALRYLLKPVAPAVLSQTAADAIRLSQMAKIKQKAFEFYGRATNGFAELAQLTKRFDRALDQLYMAYQPIVRWSLRDVHAQEALVRTGEESLGRPDLLFCAAEKLERLVDLGRVIRRQVANTIAQSEVECVFVNLHPFDLEDEELFSPASPLSQVASRVVLEITERASLHRVGDLRAKVASLRRLGYRIAVDDLGAGYAGLTAFAQLNPDVVKLDMGLVRDVDSEPTKAKLIESMTTLCRELGMLVVAEGIETVAERDTLVGCGCDLLQGYLFAKPGPPFPEVRLAF